MTTQDGALVLLSGGQDSATCLAWALERFARVETIGFDYGQRHKVELDCRAAVRGGIAALDPRWAARLGEDHMLDLSVLGEVSQTALTRDVAVEMSASGLPNTFVPGRNLLFFTLAAADGPGHGRVCPGRADDRDDSHLLSRRPDAPARLGVWLRDLSRLRAAGGGLCAVCDPAQRGRGISAAINRAHSRLRGDERD